MRVSFPCLHCLEPQGHKLLSTVHGAVLTSPLTNDECLLSTYCGPGLPGKQPWKTRDSLRSRSRRGSPPALAAMTCLPKGKTLPWPGSCALPHLPGTPTLTLSLNTN